MIDDRIRQVRERELAWDRDRSERMRAGIERKATARANRRRVAAMARSGLVFAAFLVLAVRAFAGVAPERAAASSAEVDALQAHASSVPAPRLALDDGGSRGDVALRD